MAVQDMTSAPRGPQRASLLGELLLQQGLIGSEELARALSTQEKLGGHLGTNLLEEGAITETKLLEVLGEQRQTATVSAAELADIPPDVLQLIPPRLARRHLILPFRLTGRTLHLAAVEPAAALLVEDEIRMLTSCMVRTYVGLEFRIRDAIQKVYGGSADTRLAALARRLAIPTAAEAARSALVYQAGRAVPTDPADSQAASMEEARLGRTYGRPAEPVETDERPPTSADPLPAETVDAATQEVTRVPDLPHQPLQLDPEPPSQQKGSNAPPDSAAASDRFGHRQHVEDLEHAIDHHASTPIGTRGAVARQRGDGVDGGESSGSRGEASGLSDDSGPGGKLDPHDPHDTGPIDEQSLGGAESPALPSLTPASFNVSVLLDEDVTASESDDAAHRLEPADDFDLRGVAEEVLGSDSPEPGSPEPGAPEPGLPETRSQELADHDTTEFETGRVSRTWVQEISRGGRGAETMEPQPIASTLESLQPSPPDSSTKSGGDLRFAVLEGGGQTGSEPPVDSSRPSANTSSLEPVHGNPFAGLGLQPGDVGEAMADPSPQLTATDPDERLEEASLLLQCSEMRDDIADAVLSFCEPFFERRLLLVRRRGDLVGWRAEGRGISPLAFERLTLDAVSPSVFAPLDEVGTIHGGALPEIGLPVDFSAALNYCPPEESVIVPIRLGDRVVAYLWADNIDESVRQAPLAQLQRLARKASLALEIIILKNRIRMM